MKTLRGLYVASMYILAAPFAMGMAVVMLVIGIAFPTTTFKAIVEGIKIGHRQNVLFVKYGKNYLNHLEEL